MVMLTLFEQSDDQTYDAIENVLIKAANNEDFSKDQKLTKQALKWSV